MPKAKWLVVLQIIAHSPGLSGVMYTVAKEPADDSVIKISTSVNSS